eukprot:m.363043 g.363043  ORF g.363043 m.363043 type:complete len:366 (-) comp16652_c3_seq7:543-1640(-)
MQSLLQLRYEQRTAMILSKQLNCACPCRYFNLCSSLVTTRTLGPNSLFGTDKKRTRTDGQGGVPKASRLVLATATEIFEKISEYRERETRLLVRPLDLGIASLGSIGVWDTLLELYETVFLRFVCAQGDVKELCGAEVVSLAAASGAGKSHLLDAMVSQRANVLERIAGHMESCERRAYFADNLKRQFSGVMHPMSTLTRQVAHAQFLVVNYNGNTPYDVSKWYDRDIQTGLAARLLFAGLELRSMEEMDELHTQVGGLELSPEQSMAALRKKFGDRNFIVVLDEVSNVPSEEVQLQTGEWAHINPVVALLGKTLLTTTNANGHDQVSVSTVSVKETSAPLERELSSCATTRTLEIHHHATDSGG